MIRVACLAAIAALLTMTSATAADQSAKDDRICTTEMVVGSHLPKRVCTTAAQRDAMHRSGQESLGGFQSKASRSNSSAGGK